MQWYPERLRWEENTDCKNNLQKNRLFIMWLKFCSFFPKMTVCVTALKVLIFFFLPETAIKEKARLKCELLVPFCSDRPVGLTPYNCYSNRIEFHSRGFYPVPATLKQWTDISDDPIKRLPLYKLFSVIRFHQIPNRTSGEVEAENPEDSDSSVRMSNLDFNRNTSVYF